MSTNSNKKLLVINQFASTPKYSTGAGERMFFLSKHLLKAGWNTEVISGSFNHLFLKTPKTKGQFTTEIYEHVIYVWVKLRKYSATSSFGRIWAFFEFLFKLFLYPIKKSKLPDIVLVSSMSIFPSIYAIYLKRRYKIPFILEVRDIWPLTPIELGGYSPKHPFIKLLSFIENLAYKNADYIISVLPQFDKYLAEKGFSDKQFKWIPNGISEDIIHNKNNLNSNIKNGSLKIVYAGAIGTANALDTLIQASKKVNDIDVHFYIYGDGHERQFLEKATKSQSNISFLGKVMKDEIITVLKEFDLAYIGWRKKNLYKYGISANKYNDYMLAELPILSASGLSNDPVLKAECGVMVEADEVDAIVNAILLFYKMSAIERKSLGSNGRKYVLQNQTYEILSSKYISVLESVYN